MNPNGVGNERFGPRSAQEVTPQSEVTVNASVNPFLQKERTGGLGPRLGDVTTNPQLSLLQGEMAFTPTNGGGSLFTNTSFSCEVFTSFNGLSLAGIHTESDLYRSVRFVGMVNSPVMFEQEVVTNSGCAIRAAGSGSLLSNEGNDTFQCGDMLGFELPPLNKSDLELWMQRAPARGDNSIGGKILARPKRVRPTDIVYRLHDSVDLLLSDPNSLKYDINLFRTNKGMGKRELKSEEEVAVLLNNFIMTVSYNAIITALQNGLVIPSYNPLDPSFLPGTNKDQGDSLKEQIAPENPTLWYKRSVTLGADGSVQVEKGLDEEAQEKLRAGYGEFAKLLAVWLGIARRPASLPTQNDIHGGIHSTILVRSLQSATTNKVIRTLGAKLCATDFPEDTQIFLYDNFNRKVSRKTIPGQIILSQTSCASLFTAAYGQMMNETMARVIGKVTNVSPPGGVVHYVI